MGEVNAALAGGHILTIGDERYVVKPPKQRCYSEFEAWLEGQARMKLLQAKKYLPDDVYEQETIDLRQRINSLEFTWGKPLVKSALGSIPGMSEFIAIMIRQTDPSMTAERVQNLMQKDPDQCSMVFKGAVAEGEKVFPPTDLMR